MTAGLFPASLPALGRTERTRAVALPDKVIAFGVLLLMSKAILMLALTGGDITAIDLADGSIVYQLLAAAAYAVCAARVWRDARKRRS